MEPLGRGGRLAATCATPSAGASTPWSTSPELDEDRARDWVVVRELHNALWTLEDTPRGGLDADDREWLTRCVTIAKAVQD